MQIFDFLFYSYEKVFLSLVVFGEEKVWKNWPVETNFKFFNFLFGKVDLWKIVVHLFVIIFSIDF